MLPKSLYSLDRIDVDKGYHAHNCGWADRKTQNRNQRRHKNKIWSD